MLTIMFHLASVKFGLILQSENSLSQHAGTAANGANSEGHATKSTADGQPHTNNTRWATVGSVGQGRCVPLSLVSVRQHRPLQLHHCGFARSPIMSLSKTGGTVWAADALVTGSRCVLCNASTVNLCLKNHQRQAARLIKVYFGPEQSSTT